MDKLEFKRIVNDFNNKYLFYVDDFVGFYVIKKLFVLFVCVVILDVF